MPDLNELDSARERWRRMRRRLGQSADPDVQPTGFAHRLESLSARLVILPGDPFATELSFDTEFGEWWTNEGPAPFGAQVQWTNTEPSVDAAVKYKGTREKWTTYLAVHRHGGIEVGSDPAWSGDQGQRFFRLVHMVGLVWIAVSAQAEAVARVGLSGPWELTLVLHQTANAYLAGFGTGWAEPHQGLTWGPRAQGESQIMIRRELDSFPVSENEVKDLTFEIGARIENAWGTTHRRFLDRDGDMKEQFNPDRWYF